MQFRAHFLANLIEFASQQGADSKALLAVVGKRIEELDGEELFFSATIYNRLIELAADQTKDPLLGLHMGNYMSLSAAGLIGQITQSSRTILEAIEYIVHFANLGCQAMPFQLEEGKEEWQLSLHPNEHWLEQSPLAVRHTLDGVLIFTLREIRALTRHQYHPNRVDISFPKPADFSEYEVLFHCPVRFSQPISAIYLDKNLVKQTVKTSDYNLLRVLVKYAEEKLQEMEKEQSFSSVVQRAILNLVAPKFPSIDQVATNLNLSVRTLQRRLKEEDLTFKKVFDQLRQQLALDYLLNPSLSIKEIAYLLDYADTSSFVRSFRRWKGQSPEYYRKRSLN